MAKIHPINDIKNFFVTYKLNYKIIFILLIITIFGSFLGITLGRFVYLEVRHSIFTTNNFYFNSDKMAETTSVYQLNNWGGAEVYTIIFNMNSLKNNEVGATSDINYNISFSCTDNVICQASKTSSTISSTTHRDSFTITITPNATFSDGDSVTLNVSATSTSPYTKTISGRFKLVIGRAGLTYEIEDVANRPYLEVRITNTLDYYLVREAFNSYVVGDRLDTTTYQNLSAENKAKCASTIITLNFNPANVVLDMTSKAYLKGYNFANTNVNGIDYISSFSFKMDALSSEIVNFYKITVSNNYTYPIINANPVVNVTYS
jgi:hypothetical protein